MATMSPELILASYSCARRDHMVRLMRARPLRVSSARLTSAPSASLRMPTAGDLRGRHPQRHLVLDEVDDEQLELGARDLLLLDGDDLADAVGRIDDEFVGLEALALGRLLGVIPGTTPCSGLRRPSALATGAHGAAVPREACEVRRTRQRLVSWPAGLRRTSPSWSSDASSLPQLMRALGTPLHGFIWVSPEK